jgi:hypothetical protein
MWKIPVCGKSPSDTLPGLPTRQIHLRPPQRLPRLRLRPSVLNKSNQVSCCRGDTAVMNQHKDREVPLPQQQPDLT